MDAEAYEAMQVSQMIQQQKNFNIQRGNTVELEIKIFKGSDKYEPGVGRSNIIINETSGLMRSLNNSNVPNEEVGVTVRRMIGSLYNI